MSGFWIMGEGHCTRWAEVAKDGGTDGQGEGEGGVDRSNVKGQVKASFPTNGGAVPRWRIR